MTETQGYQFPFYAQTWSNKHGVFRSRVIDGERFDEKLEGQDWVKVDLESEG